MSPGTKKGKERDINRHAHNHGCHVMPAKVIGIPEKKNTDLEEKMTWKH